MIGLNDVDQHHSGKLPKTSIQFALSKDLPHIGRKGWGDRRRLHHSTKDIEAILRNPRKISPETGEWSSSGTIGGSGGSAGSQGSCTRQWEWCRRPEGSWEENMVDQSGFSLPTSLKLGTVGGLEVFLICYVSFDFFVQDSERQAKRGLAKAFQVAAKKGTIVWIMQKPSTAPNQHPTPILRTIDFASTLDIGWVPDDAVDFFHSFMVDLHEKWRDLVEKADIHLDQSRKTLLDKQGKSAGFIEVLLLDAQTWSNARSLLQIQVRTARDILTDFRETKYLQDEIVGAEVALEGLCETIDKMEKEILDEIKDLDDKTQKMIELEFSLVSIYERRTSKEMGMSMKRLSWITFIFLPLMFVASLFGMNIDIVDGGPNWTWVIILALCLFAIVIVVWSLLKRFPVDQWIQAHREQVDSARLQGKDSSKWYGWGFWRKQACEQDLESGESFEFRRPQRRWTIKLKDH